MPPDQRVHRSLSTPPSSDPAEHDPYDLRMALEIVPDFMSSQVPIELQSVANGVAHVELASTPRRVGYLSSVGQWPELIRQPVDVVNEET